MHLVTTRRIEHRTNDETIESRISIAFFDLFELKIPLYSELD